MKNLSEDFTDRNLFAKMEASAFAGAFLITERKEEK